MQLYRPVEHFGDSVPVPQVIFSKLTAPGANDARFRVALYALSETEVTAAKAARALSLKEREVERALEYWEGAGLLERVGLNETQQLPVLPVAKQRLDSASILEAGQKDPTVGVLCNELQRIIGGVISRRQMEIFACLYIQDGYPVDLIMMAASHCATIGKVNASYIEQVLQTWRREGIRDSDSADRYLRLLEQRAQREREVAELMRMQDPAFSLAEKKRIAQWFEEYRFSVEMVQAARLVAGDKENEVRYVGAILKKWHSKGYRNLRDMQMGENNHNIRVQTQQETPAGGGDDLLVQSAYVPMRRQGDER